MRLKEIPMFYRLRHLQSGVYYNRTIQGEIFCDRKPRYFTSVGALKNSLRRKRDGKGSPFNPQEWALEAFFMALPDVVDYYDQVLETHNYDKAMKEFE